MISYLGDSAEFLIAILEALFDFEKLLSPRTLLKAYSDGRGAGMSFSLRIEAGIGPTVFRSPET